MLPYNRRQFFVRCPDEQVEQWLKMFTLLELEQIAELMERHKVPNDFQPTL